MNTPAPSISTAEIVTELRFRATLPLDIGQPCAIPPHGGQPAIMDSMPDAPDPQTRTAVTQRIIAHVTRGWPRLGEPVVRHRGQYCHVSARLPGEREPAPILRLRYQGSADRWAIGIYLASSDRYTEAELPTSFGPKTGTLWRQKAASRADHRSSAGAITVAEDRAGALTQDTSEVGASQNVP